MGQRGPGGPGHLLPLSHLTPGLLGLSYSLPRTPPCLLPSNIGSKRIPAVALCLAGWAHLTSLNSLLCRWDSQWGLHLELFLEPKVFACRQCSGCSPQRALGTPSLHGYPNSHRHPLLAWTWVPHLAEPHWVRRWWSRGHHESASVSQTTEEWPGRQSGMSSSNF